MILCDIGNTTFHFLINGEHKKFFLNEDLPNFDEKIYFISVNETATSKLLTTYKNAVNLEKYLDFHTTYKGMGVDRKVACYGYENSIIVDAGSAITVDIMKDFSHKGGFILPGFKNFHNIYKQISSKLDFDFTLKQNLDKIPQNTQEAISYAILKAIILPIKDISGNNKLLFTGGDGKILSSFFENSVYKEDLIFENMKRIIDANNCIA